MCVWACVCVCTYVCVYVELASGYHICPLIYPLLAYIPLDIPSPITPEAKHKNTHFFSPFKQDEKIHLLVT